MAGYRMSEVMWNKCLQKKKNELLVLPTHKTKPIENTAVLVATNIDREKERQ